MPETSTLIHFALLGACAVTVAVGLGYVLSKVRLPYFAGLLCSVAVGSSAIVGLFLEEGLAYPPERDWHHILWAMFGTSLVAGVIQIGRWQAMVDAVVVALATGIATQSLIPAVGSDELFDEHRLFWLVVPLVAAALNSSMLSFKQHDGAASWGLWVLVAQMTVISVALMLSYGTLAGVALGMTAVTTILAIAMTVVSVLNLKETLDPDPVHEPGPTPAIRVKAPFTWLARAVVPIGLAAILLTICARTYSYGVMASWLYIPMLFLPTIVYAADTLIFKKLRLGWRVLIAGTLTTGISAAAVVYMVAASGPTY